MKSAQPVLIPSPIFIGKWTPRILFSLEGRPHRHGELRRQLVSVSQRMLTRSLRKLEAGGLISKRVIRAKTVAVEYSLTRVGRTILAPLRGMCRWATQYRKVVTAEVHLRDANSSAPGVQNAPEIDPERGRT